ncbi:MAG: Gfo/Idh/MocA family oxidoreductase [bacterium]|nr:Gfo/Idh/MocA family oxidoreductase [bacterium]
MSVRVGIVGLGWWGEQLMDYFRNTPGVEVPAVVNKIPVTKDLQGARFYDDSSEMMDKEQPDAVVIATPPTAHKEVTRQAAQRGIHVFCEKPMAATLEDCDDMIAACLKSNTKLMVAFKHRFAGSFAHLKARAADFGKPQWAMYTYPLWKVDDPGWKFQDRGTRGIIVENVVHAIDGLIYLMGDVESVYAEGNRAVFKHPTLPDSAIFTLRFKNGAIASIGGGCTSDRRISREYLDIHYEEGLAQIEGALDYPINLRLLDRGKEAVEEYSYPGSDGVKEEAEHFIRCIQEDTEPICNGVEGRKSLEVALAVLESIQSRKVITLWGGTH